MQQRKRRPQKVSDTCPKCGYCDTCGRANAAPVRPYPYVPYVPFVNPYPYFRPVSTVPYPYPVTIIYGNTTGCMPVCGSAAFDASGLCLFGDVGVDTDSNSIKFDANGTLTAN